MDIIVIVDILIALAVAGLQILYFQRTSEAARKLGGIFPAKHPMAIVASSHRLADEAASNDLAHGVSILSDEEISDGFQSILNAANQYLNRNRGMPVNFLVLQDIVERVADSHEQAALSNVTLPLYIGLMGTFIGIIVGLLSLAAGQHASIDDTDLQHFLSGVLVAMGGSLLGLILYVFGRRLLSVAQAAVSARKRDFSIFLQSELLPVAGQEVSAALFSLEANLRSFNEDFRKNLNQFGAAMEAPARSLQQQKELLEALQKTDLQRILQANAEMLEALRTAAPTLQGFFDATHGFIGDLRMTGQITQKLSSLMDRISTFETSINDLGLRLQTEGTMTEHAVSVIRNQLNVLEDRKNLVVQYADESNEAIRISLSEQQVALDNLLAAANQEIAGMGKDLSRSIGAAMGGDKATELFANVALLKDIERRLGASEKSLASIASAPPQDMRVAELLQQILGQMRFEASRPRIGNLLQRIFPRDKTPPPNHGY